MLTAGDTTIDTVDGRWVRSGRVVRYRLLPGRHEVEVNLETASYGPTTFISTSRPSRVCFVAKAGRSYRTHPVIEGKLWHPTVTDEEESRAVEVSCSVDDTSTPGAEFGQQAVDRSR